MRETETNHHRLQEIRLLLKFHTQLASTDKITGLTINMKFSTAGSNWRLRPITIQEPKRTINEQAGYMEQNQYTIQRLG